MDRIEEIKNNLERNRTFLEEYNRGGECNGLGSLRYVDDVPYLLERVSQLEQSKDRTQKIAEQLAKDYQAASERVSQLERENKELHEFVDYVNRELPKINSKFERWLT